MSTTTGITTGSARHTRPPAAPIERHPVHPSASPRRRARPQRPWGLIAVLAGFLVAAAMVIGIGVVSLGLDPVLP